MLVVAKLSPSWNSRWASLLVLLMIYQLGGCPCGCWDHNQWWELVSESRHEHGDSSDHVQHSIAAEVFHCHSGQCSHSEDEHDCECRLPSYHRLGTRETLVSSLAPGFSPLQLISVKPISGFSTDATHPAIRQTAVLTMRAVRQV